MRRPIIVLTLPRDVVIHNVVVPVTSATDSFRPCAVKHYQVVQAVCEVSRAVIEWIYAS